jgi:exopolysaccharide biosynthesis WecB/TagA/CpsF family protein
MLDLGKHNILGVLVNAIDYDYATAQIIAAAHQKQPYLVSALAVHGIMTGAHDHVQRYRLNQFDLITPDGQPVRWALRWLHGIALPDRVYGPTLTLKVCEQAAQEQLPIYLYGSQANVLAALERNLIQKFPKLRIAGKQPSKFRQITPTEMQAVAQEIRNSGACITLIGLGCPRQEVWAYEYRQALSMPIMAVGAAFDFHSGNRAQAPSQLQKLGLEWLFRLVHEPRRLWRRYVILSPQFLFLCALQAARIYTIDPESGAPPQVPMLYG